MTNLLDLHPVLAELDRSAVRRLTPCGDGHIVWHQWGEARSGQAPLVLFHGGSGSWMHWVRNISTLAASGRQLWVVDLPGFGESDLPPEGRDADALVAPLAQGLREMLGGQRCDLVGFSFGGLTAGLLLAAHHDLARHLVLVGAPGLGLLAERPFELRAWRHLENEAEQAQVHRHNLQVLMLHDPAKIDDLALALHVANMARDRMPRRRLAHTDILARHLPQVRCRVSAIYGAHDVLYGNQMHRLGDVLAAAAPQFDCLQLVPDAGHWVQYEAPAAFDAALLAVLD